ncbi:hypothetical protein Hypma_013864 [Hypsizygus marmoreus]|uniref:Uncharacterized protein n=1 Tax=Hypsizygus marmoreus TaxID=39966 RepID=A0A369K5Z8_HYPMA|nr:hypothetical protein Hypma_013864 [Hypsizygus marmoreus]
MCRSHNLTEYRISVRGAMRAEIFPAPTILPIVLTQSAKASRQYAVMAQDPNHSESRNSLHYDIWNPSAHIMHSSFSWPYFLRHAQTNTRLSACLILLVLIPIVSGVRFDQCLNDIRSGKHGELGGTDNRGRPVSDIANATAISYDLCITACGAGSEPFAWSIFSTQFSSWLLPWLALVSQLPFGANDKLDNLVSMLMTVGSPTLAAYSLALTVLNGRWIAKRFASHSYPNLRNAVRILSSLQQSPLRVTTDGSLLSSLVVLPENDDWWSELVMWLDYTHTWSISAVTSISWVIIAYIFTVVDSFTGDITAAVNANGQGVGSLWIWLLPIVIGWLQISPKCDSVRLYQAIARANKIAYVATPSGRPVPASSLSRRRAITLAPGPEDALRRDEGCTAPIYNYARFLPWVQAVEDVRSAFSAASDHAHLHRSVDPEINWEKEDRFASGPSRVNREGTRAQVDAYCTAIGEHTSTRSAWGPHVWSRLCLASILALFLQWGATGAAIIVVWFTPTTGLGCRSGAYLLYGALSTVVWFLLVLSSLLSHYAMTTPHASGKPSVRIARLSSIAFRRLGKLVATCNAIWIVMTCLFQFTNFFDRCYCNSSVLGRGFNSYNVVEFMANDILGMRGAWIGGVVLAAGSATMFVVFVNLFINPQLPD